MTSPCGTSVFYKTTTDVKMAKELDAMYGAGCRFFLTLFHSDEQNRLKEMGPKTMAFGKGVGWITPDFIVPSNIREADAWLDGWLTMQIWINPELGQYSQLETGFKKFWTPPPGQPYLLPSFTRALIFDPLIPS